MGSVLQDGHLLPPGSSGYKFRMGGLGEGGCRSIVCHCPGSHISLSHLPSSWDYFFTQIISFPDLGVQVTARRKGACRGLRGGRVAPHWEKFPGRPGHPHSSPGFTLNSQPRGAVQNQRGAAPGNQDQSWNSGPTHITWSLETTQLSGLRPCLDEKE